MYVLLSIIFPPLAVGFKRGFGIELIICSVLWAFGWIPGTFYALFIVLQDDEDIKGVTSALNNELFNDNEEIERMERQKIYAKEREQKKNAEILPTVNIQNQSNAIVELQKLVELHKSGYLTDAEFQVQKSKLLNS